MREGRNQYAPMPGVLALREAIAAMYSSAHGRSYDPETRDHRHVGGDRGHLRRGRGAGASRRRGHRSRAVLRLVRAGDRAQRRRAGCGALAVSAGTRSTGIAVGAAITGRTRMLIDQHAAQSDRRGAVTPRSRHPRRARGRHRRPRPRRRGLPAHHLRRPRARKPGPARRARRPQHRHRLVRQDLSRDGMESRLCRRARGADRRTAQGAPVRDVLDQHPGAARDRGVPRRGARPRRARPLLPGEARSFSAR